MMSKIHKARYSTEVPNIDLCSYIFSSGDAASRQRPQFFNAFDPSRCYSLAEGELFAKQLGLGLQRLGLQPDDKVLLFSGNNLFFPVLLWGTVAAGCVFTACSPSATASELQYQLQDSEAKLLLTSVEGASIALKAASALGFPQSQIYVFADPFQELSQDELQTLKPWSSIWASSEDAANWFWKRSSDPTYLSETTVILNYSSGTTGTPKAVEITHENVVANSTQLIYYRTLVADTPDDRARAARLERSGERWLAPLPMYHAYGQMYYCVNAPRQRATVFIMPKYDVKRLLLFLDIYRITFFTGVPVLMVQVSKQPSRYNLNSLEYVLTGSAPLGADIAAIIERRFLPPGLFVKQGWGMTETTCSITGFTPGDAADGHSVGYVNPNCVAKIVPIEGQSWGGDAPEGATVGEIWVSGANIMKGYYNRKKETDESIVYEDGYRWMRTGDVGYVSDEGKVYIVDRLKELIKVKGLQVAPAELEAAILEHEGVLDAVVTGAKIQDGEYPRAFVVRKDSTITQDTIKEIISSRFARHKWLTGGVFFIDEIPRTASGKAMRRKLPNPSGNESKL